MKKRDSFYPAFFYLIYQNAFLRKVKKNSFKNRSYTLLIVLIRRCFKLKDALFFTGNKGDFLLHWRHIALQHKSISETESIYMSSAKILSQIQMRIGDYAAQQPLSGIRIVEKSVIQGLNDARFIRAAPAKQAS